MSKNEGFKVEISSDFEEFWCYNVAVTCGCFDEEERRVGFASADDAIAPVGSNLKKAPSDYPAKRLDRFETEECHHLLMYIYIIPHTIPIDRVIDEHKPFPLKVRVSRGGKVVTTQTLPVNRWSGASLELRVGEEK